QHAAGNLDNRHAEIVCAASAHVNVSILYQPLTAPARLGLLASPRGGKSRSGSAWLGRSQKDGLPSCRGWEVSFAGQGHRLAHRGGAASSLPLSKREREWTPRRATLALAAALSSVRQCMHRQRMRQPFINDYVDIVIAIPKALVMHTLSSAARA